MSAKIAIKIADAKAFKRFSSLANNKELLSAFKKRIKDLSDGGKQFFDDFADASDDVLKRFVEKPELVDAWKKIRAANPEVSKNIGALEALNAPKGSRPDPKTYLSSDYVAKHLDKFKDGASCLAPSNVRNFDQLGRSDGLFVMPKKEMDDLLKRTGGDISKIEKELGIPEGEWLEKKVQIMRFDIDKENINNRRMPGGNEIGANSEWIPGGFTPTGNSEAVINAVDWTNVIQTKISKIE